MLPDGASTFLSPLIFPLPPVSLLTARRDPANVAPLPTGVPLERMRNFIPFVMDFFPAGPFNLGTGISDRPFVLLPDFEEEVCIEDADDNGEGSEF